MPPYDPRTRKEGNGGVAVGVTPPSSAPKVFLLAPLSLQIGALEAPCRRAGVTPLPPGWSAQFGKSGVAQLSTGWALAGPTGGISAQRKPSNCAKLEGPGCVEWSNCMVPISISTLTSRFCAGQKGGGGVDADGPFRAESRYNAAHRCFVSRLCVFLDATNCARRRYVRQRISCRVTGVSRVYKQ